MTRLTKKKATELFKQIVGSASGVSEDSDNYFVDMGEMRFIAGMSRISAIRIHVQILLGASLIATVYYNFETLERDYDYENRVLQDHQNE